MVQKNLFWKRVHLLACSASHLVHTTCPPEAVTAACQRLPSIGGGLGAGNQKLLKQWRDVMPWEHPFLGAGLLFPDYKRWEISPFYPAHVSYMLLFLQMRMHFLTMNHVNQQVGNFIIEEPFLASAILISKASVEILRAEASDQALLM